MVRLERELFLVHRVIVLEVKSVLVLVAPTKPRRFFRRDLIFLCFASRGGAGREFPGSKIQIFSRQPCLGEENFDFFSRQPFPGEENFDFFLAMARNWLILRDMTRPGGAKFY